MPKTDEEIEDSFLEWLGPLELDKCRRCGGEGEMFMHHTPKPPRRNIGDSVQCNRCGWQTRIHRKHADARWQWQNDNTGEPKMVNLFQDIKDFHEKFGLGYDGKPRKLPLHLSLFREKFLDEELTEYRHAAFGAHLVSKTSPDAEKYAEQLELALDGLVDLVYVALGTAYLHGFDFEEAWRRVHAANMQKMRAARESDSKRGSTFDVVKPEGWVAPTHRDLVEDNDYEG